MHPIRRFLRDLLDSQRTLWMSPDDAHDFIMKRIEEEEQEEKANRTGGSPEPPS